MIALQHPRLRMTMVLAVVAALALGLAGRAAAAEHPHGYRFAASVDLAGANWTTIEDGVFADLTIMVTKGSETVSDQPGFTRFDPGVTIFYDRWATDPDTAETTHVTYTTLAGLPPSAFAFQPSLRTASASFATVLTDGTRCVYPASPGGPVEGIVPASDDDPTCELLPDLPATVELVWTGQGETYRDAWSSRATDTPLVRYFNHQVSAARDAAVTARLQLDTADLAPEVVIPDRDPDYGVLLRGRYHERLLDVS
jgi:hypothetical protein